eukprot:2706684-Pyramimonas_sp.AAC.1
MGFNPGKPLGPPQGRERPRAGGLAYTLVSGGMFRKGVDPVKPGFVKKADSGAKQKVPESDLLAFAGTEEA